MAMAAVNGIPPLCSEAGSKLPWSKSTAVARYCTLPEAALEAMTQGHVEPDQELLESVGSMALKSLMDAASSIRDQRIDGKIVTFSPKVFIPLTRACRDSCGYCTFARAPKSGKSVFMTIDEVLAVSKAGVRGGCTEALFTLGDKPELRYSQAEKELSAMGHSSTVSYVAEAARIVLEETGLLPHINAGVMNTDEIALLRQVSVSQGLMLESTAEALLLPEGPHHNCPDKVPSARLSTIRKAGELKVPFTSGILVGIGESRRDRLKSLLCLRDLHLTYGHIQEIIIQNFRAKKGTPMESSPEPSLEELLWTVAVARIAFGPDMNIQAPPNLAVNREADWKQLVHAGINDWGGISSVTRDWVNPEAPWPHLELLAGATMDCGKVLVPRLPVYPSYVCSSSEWLDPGVVKWVHQASDSQGYARADTWSAGTNVSFDDDREASKVALRGDGSISMESSFTNAKTSVWLEFILEKALAGDDLTRDEIVRLFSSVGPDFEAVCNAADSLRETVNGHKVTYVVNRNINYTNICSFKCQFCAFSKGKHTENLRGKSYRLPLEEISARTMDAWKQGATEVCMQGGIHPEFTGETYLDILNAVKSTVPSIHVHAFSPLEVQHGASTLGMSCEEFLLLLKASGLGSLPGTAAEILEDSVRSELCADKLTTGQWLEVIETAHSLGIRTTSTIMFGHIDRPWHWANHLLHIRQLQKKTGGFTEFVPLPFVHMQAPIFLKGRARRGPTRRECILMHAVSRLALHPFITNIQASWVKTGPGGALRLLNAGCNDMGGTLMNESISRAAGATHGQELSPQDMEQLITSAGRRPCQRTTLYADC